VCSGFCCSSIFVFVFLFFWGVFCGEHLGGGGETEKTPCAAHGAAHHAGLPGPRSGETPIDSPTGISPPCTICAGILTHAIATPARSCLARQFRFTCRIHAGSKARAPGKVLNGSSAVPGGIGFTLCATGGPLLCQSLNLPLNDALGDEFSPGLIRLRTSTPCQALSAPAAVAKPRSESPCEDAPLRPLTGKFRRAASRPCGGK